MKALMNFHPQGCVLRAVLVMSVAAFLVLIACQPDGRTAEPPIRSTVEPSVQSTAEPTVESTTEPPVESTAEPPIPSTAEPPIQSTAEPTVDNTAEPTVSSTSEPTVYSTGEIMEITVGPDLVDCVGVAPQKCLVVNGSLFYDSIDSFNYSEGYTWRLKVERYDAWPDLDEPPQDAGRYGYRIIDVVSKTWDDARGPRPARDIFSDNFYIYVANKAVTYLHPHSSMEELVDKADVIAIGSVAAVIATGLQVPYNEADNTRLDEYNARYGNPSPFPPPDRSWPYIDYWIDVETVILDDGTISSGSPLILRVFDRWQAVKPYPWMWRVPSIGDRRLYALAANPEGGTHSLARWWNLFIIEGDEVTHSDDLRSPVYLTDQVKPDDFIKALEDAVDRKNE